MLCRADQPVAREHARTRRRTPQCPHAGVPGERAASARSRARPRRRSRGEAPMRRPAPAPAPFLGLRCRRAGARLARVGVRWPGGSSRSSRSPLERVTGVRRPGSDRCRARQGVDARYRLRQASQPGDRGRDRENSTGEPRRARRAPTPPPARISWPALIRARRRTPRPDSVVRAQGGGSGCLEEASRTPRPCAFPGRPRFDRAPSSQERSCAAGLPKPAHERATGPRGGGGLGSQRRGRRRSSSTDRGAELVEGPQRRGAREILLIRPSA